VPGFRRWRPFQHPHFSTRPHDTDRAFADQTAPDASGEIVAVVLEILVDHDFLAARHGWQINLDRGGPGDSARMGLERFHNDGAGEAGQTDFRSIASGGIVDGQGIQASPVAGDPDGLSVVLDLDGVPSIPAQPAGGVVTLDLRCAVLDYLQAGAGAVELEAYTGLSIPAAPDNADASRPARFDHDMDQAAGRRRAENGRAVFQAVPGAAANGTSVKPVGGMGGAVPLPVPAQVRHPDAVDSRAIG
jgi:hypothetical protein